MCESHSHARRVELLKTFSAPFEKREKGLEMAVLWGAFSLQVHTSSTHAVPEQLNF